MAAAMVRFRVAMARAEAAPAEGTDFPRWTRVRWPSAGMDEGMRRRQTGLRGEIAIKSSMVG
jgi:hypothetical protein